MAVSQGLSDLDAGWFDGKAKIFQIVESFRHL
jgi:hypothetical protein